MSAHRALFLVPGEGPYLLSHSVGCLPRAARARLDDDMLTPWAELGSDGWGNWLGVIDRFRGAAAGLIGAEPEEICPQPTVSSALFNLLSGLKREPGRDILLASAHAFSSLVFAMERLQRLGYRLELLPEDVDPGDPQSWIDAIDERVAAVVPMHVHSNSGVVSPIVEIATAARRHGVFSIVDAAQSVGILPVTPRAWGVDAVLGTSVKWLCGGPGAPFLWVRRELVAEIEPIDVGWFSHENPFAFDVRDFRYAGDARRFWGGTPTIAPFSLATTGIETIAAIGVDTALEWNRTLIAHLEVAADRRFDMANQGGTLCLAAEDIEGLATALGDAGCRFDRRGDVVRASFHVWNSIEDAELVGGILRDFPAHQTGADRADQRKPLGRAA
jgi:selenocysteine lyase/cysteine desulfurase